MVLESTGDTAIQMMVKLLKVLWQTGLITLDQMNRVCTNLTYFFFFKAIVQLGDILVPIS